MKLHLVSPFQLLKGSPPARGRGLKQQVFKPLVAKVRRPPRGGVD